MFDTIKFKEMNWSFEMCKSKFNKINVVWIETKRNHFYT